MKIKIRGNDLAGSKAQDGGGCWIPRKFLARNMRSQRKKAAIGAGRGPVHSQLRKIKGCGHIKCRKTLVSYIAYRGRAMANRLQSHRQLKGPGLM